MSYWPRDFVETREGLFFAVVACGTEEERVPGLLRYVRQGGAFRKLATPEADELLRRACPEYLFHSSLRDVDLHGVPLSRICRHHRPRIRAAALAGSRDPDPLERKAARVLRLFAGAGIPTAFLGVTGSLLLGAHTEASDIDVVVYDRAHFHTARETIRAATARGDLDPMNEDLWEDAFARRACSLSLEEYVWHERRKHNKCVIGGTKVDVSLVTCDAADDLVGWRKVAQAEIRAEVRDDGAAFDYPARFGVAHPEVSEVVAYTNTFTGQARRGETILARGWKERSGGGDVRLVVGTSREAGGEFIRVLRG